MKNRPMVLAGLSVVVSVWLLLAYTSYYAHTSELGSFETVTLRIEGMT